MTKMAIIDLQNVRIFLTAVSDSNIRKNHHLESSIACFDDKGKAIAIKRRCVTVEIKTAECAAMNVFNCLIER